MEAVLREKRVYDGQDYPPMGGVPLKLFYDGTTHEIK